MPRARGRARGVCDDCDLVVTSSMTRCVQTSLLSFPTLTRAARDAVPFVANEDLRETANYWCDRRRTTEELEREFGDRVDFSACPMRDELWERYERIAGAAGRVDEASRVVRLVLRRQSVSSVFRVARTQTGAENRGEHALGAAALHVFVRSSRRRARGAGTDFRFRRRLWGDTSKGVPVVSYGDDVDFAARMREDFDNCEYRTCFVDFAPRAV